MSVLLDGNRITTLPPGLFDSCTSLETLSVKNNVIATLPSLFLQGSRRLESIKIGGNVLVCPVTDTTPAAVNMTRCACAIPDEQDMRYVRIASR